MYYIAHLALPALVVLIMALSGPPPELSFTGFGLTLEKLAYSYMAFSAPHWIWASISAYFDASKEATVGGFVGAHLLLISVWILVALSTTHEAANGWFIYFLGAPIAITFGAVMGRQVASWKTRQSA